MPLRTLCAGLRDHPVSAPRRWIRLDVGWEKSDWLAELPAGSRLAWVLLLGYTKTIGVAGAVKAMTPKGAAREWGVTEDEFSLMLDAAIRHGAVRLPEPETWEVTGWDRYQHDGAAERQRRHRADRSRLSPLRDVTARHGPSRSQALRSDETLTETETETEPQEQHPPQPTAVVVRANGNGVRSWNGAIVFEAWLKRFPVAAKGLSATERSKYGAVCKRLAEQHSKDEVAAAFMGIEKLYPHSDGEPWDPLTLQKKFGLALAAMENHPKVKAQREKDALMDEIQRRNGG